MLRKFGNEQPQGVHRLSQVVARGGEKPRLGEVGAFGFFLACAQFGCGFLDASHHLVVCAFETLCHFIDAFGQGGQAAAAEQRNTFVQIALADACHGFGDNPYRPADPATQTRSQQDRAQQHHQDRARTGPQQLVALLLQSSERHFDHDTTERALVELGGRAQRNGGKAVVQLQSAGPYGFDQA
ncbi:hypothetical protein SDC9_194619 [bioreactor metagenome]|uniref:Uncharacterized protein n=1 Tax=bioreactor metagenome TaxID=1076179 RepID=A0A645I9B8_9ZZZZ